MTTTRILGVWALGLWVAAVTFRLVEYVIEQRAGL